MNDKIKIYHGTSLINSMKILKNGFKEGECIGRFGKAVYFASDETGARRFSPENIILQSEITEKNIEKIFKVKYLDLKKIFGESNISWDEEEGIPMLREYVLEKNYKGTCIEYSDGELEYVIYDSSIIDNTKLQSSK